MDLTLEKRKILELLAREFPNRRAAFAEIINLQAILNLPKGTEHYLSDLHGEYEAFKHILNNCSGVIREKVELLFGDTLTPAEQAELCTLIYYPVEELERMKQGGEIPRLLYRQMLDRLIELKGEKIAVLEMRKHASWYLKGIKGNGTVRKRINQAQTRDEVAEIVDDFAVEL